MRAFVAVTVQNLFARIFTNPYEQPKIDHIRLKLESIPERRFTTIEGAWTDTTEAVPGQTVQVKVLLRPYRGSSELRTIPITIPLQADRGDNTAPSCKRLARRGPHHAPVSPLRRQNQAGGLEQFIHILNRERRNNRLYVHFCSPLPPCCSRTRNCPTRRFPQSMCSSSAAARSNATMLRESLAGEWSLPTDGVVSGAVSLSIRIR